MAPFFSSTFLIQVLFDPIFISLDVKSRSSLLYTHNGQPGDYTLSTAEEAAVETAIKNMLSEFKTASHDKHPDIFTNLVHALRKVGYSQLTKIYYSITDPAVKRYFRNIECID